MYSSMQQKFDLGRAALKQSYSYWKGKGLTNAQIGEKYGISVKTLAEVLGYLNVDGKYVKAAKVSKESKVARSTFVDQEVASILADLGSI